MAVSAFKSTSKRGDVSRNGDGGDSRLASPRSNPDVVGKKTVLRRSRSVSAFPRDSSFVRSRPDPLDSMNRRDNPLFCSTGSSPESSQESARVIHRIWDTLNVARELSLSVTSENRPGSRPGILEEGQRRGRSVSRREPSRGGSVKAPSRNVSRVDMWRRQRSVSRSHYGSPTRQTSGSEEGISAFAHGHAEEKTIKAVFEQMKSVCNELPQGDNSEVGIYETVRSEVRRAVFEIRHDLENAMQRNPNFRAADIASLTPELLNTGAVELVSDIRKDYAVKLAQTQDRMQKLKAGLAVEEQHTQELTRILKEVLPDPKTKGSSAYQAKRKTSMERKKISRRLAADAMNYFDECVSISTFDSSDFSCAEVPSDGNEDVTALIDISKVRPLDGASTSYAPSPLNQEMEHQAGNWNSSVNSKLAIGEGSDSNNFEFSINHEGAEKRKNTDVIRNLIKQFGKEMKEVDAGDDVVAHTSYDEDHYLLLERAESLLFEKVMLRNRINSGSLLLCTRSIF